MTPLDTPVIAAVSSAVIHFLWQGAALAAMLALVLPSFKTASARYLVASSALLVMPLAFVATFVWSMAREGAAQIGAVGAGSSGTDWVATLWLGGVLLTGLPSTPLGRIALVFLSCGNSRGKGRNARTPI